ncbi:uncharacterized protein LOC127366479 [Dicentrarchus labrax]|uniref:uncharacterized protein LOC127366479 n=1 Tax=Dicentrarchus labrax TaxID=13489 RepID=UPI0021F64D9C|nr:uncharacterized protein LOC127366479 [Dicentrarchus labrax]
MKNLILAAVMLQLVITQKDISKEYKFGDIISFGHPCPAPTPKTLRFPYSHYGIYVGPSTGIDVGQGDNDIFHNSGFEKPDCVFGKFKSLRGIVVTSKKNYLDGIEGFNPGTQEDITERISNATKHCETFENICAHLTTYVRYGTMSLQHDDRTKCFEAGPAKNILDQVTLSRIYEANCIKQGKKNGKREQQTQKTKQQTKAKKKTK